MIWKVGGEIRRLPASIETPASDDFLFRIHQSCISYQLKLLGCRTSLQILIFCSLDSDNLLSST